MFARSPIVVPEEVTVSAIHLKPRMLLNNPSYKQYVCLNWKRLVSVKYIASLTHTKLLWCDGLEKVFEAVHHIFGKNHSGKEFKLVLGSL